jgi:hypothetical protein
VVSNWLAQGSGSNPVKAYATAALKAGRWAPTDDSSVCRRHPPRTAEPLVHPPTCSCNPNPTCCFRTIRKPSRGWRPSGAWVAEGHHSPVSRSQNSQGEALPLRSACPHTRRASPTPVRRQPYPRNSLMPTSTSRTSAGPRFSMTRRKLEEGSAIPANPGLAIWRSRGTRTSAVRLPPSPPRSWRPRPVAAPVQFRRAVSPSVFASRLSSVGGAKRQPRTRGHPQPPSHSRHPKGSKHGIRAPTPAGPPCQGDVRTDDQPPNVERGASVDVARGLKTYMSSVRGRDWDVLSVLLDRDVLGTVRRLLYLPTLPTERIDGISRVDATDA